ncbi:MAG: hypothetical protein WBY53_01725 [Acidobacteriaceae bacterium]
MARGMVVVGACAVLALAGCGRKETKPVERPPAKPVVKLAPPTPLDEKKAELGGTTWQPRWDVIVEKDLPASLLGERAARAVRGYCPRFGEETLVQRREFWAYTFQALASAEAGLNPMSDVHHLEPAVDTIDPVTHRPARQEGLLQLKYEDARRYGCDFDWARDRRLPIKDPERTILEPANNLGCGVKIMEDQIVRLHRPLVTRASYWATLQPGTEGYRVFRRQMVNVPAGCRLPKVRRRREMAAAK